MGSMLITGVVEKVRFKPRLTDAKCEGKMDVKNAPQVSAIAVDGEEHWMGTCGWGGVSPRCLSASLREDVCVVRWLKVGHLQSSPLATNPRTIAY